MKKKVERETLIRCEFGIWPRLLAELNRYAGNQHQHNLSHAIRHLIAEGLKREKEQA